MAKLIINYIGFIALFMCIMAAFRYFTGAIEEWQWTRTLVIAAAVGLYSVWKNNKKSQLNSDNDE